LYFKAILECLFSNLLKRLLNSSMLICEIYIRIYILARDPETHSSMAKYRKSSDVHAFWSGGRQVQY
jgi:hypothetical protein